jgi:hypothetical protein
MDEVSRDGSTERLENGYIEIEFACHDGEKPSSKPTRGFFNSLPVL